MNSKELKEIEKLIDEVLENETPESLIKWLKTQRGKSLSPQEVDGWISVEDGLPESHGLFDTYYHRVRVAFEFNGFKMTEEASWLVGDRFVWHGVDITNLVTHWRNIAPYPQSKTQGH